MILTDDAAVVLVGGGDCVDNVDVADDFYSDVCYGNFFLIHVFYCVTAFSQIVLVLKRKEDKVFTAFRKIP